MKMKIQFIVRPIISTIPMHLIIFAMAPYYLPFEITCPRAISLQCRIDSDVRLGIYNKLTSIHIASQLF